MNSPYDDHSSGEIQRREQSQVALCSNGGSDQERYSDPKVDQQDVAPESNGRQEQGRIFVCYAKRAQDQSGCLRSVVQGLSVGGRKGKNQVIFGRSSYQRF